MRHKGHFLIYAAFLLPSLSLWAQTAPSNPPSPSNQASPSNETAAPPATKPEDLCTVEGQVSSAATGAPVRKAEITLHGAEPLIPGLMPVSYTATADAGGNFAIKEVEPGKYRLSVHRTGFVSLQYGARGTNRGGGMLSLAPGQRLKDLSLRLSPQAVITGRVVDEKNEPVVSAFVRTMRYGYQMGKRQLVPYGAAATNDLGEYRIHSLPPGRYYLVAAESQNDWEATVDASAAPVLETYVPTYYPGTADRSAAVPIELGPGVQLRGVNITLARARTFSVRGRVEGRSDVNISFFPRGQVPWMSDGASHAADQKGNFEIRGVLPGAYTLTADSYSNQNVLSARQEVDVGENDINNLVLVLSPGFELTGRITVESGVPPDLDSVSVNLRPQGMRRFSASAGGQVREGAFTILNVAPDLYRLQVFALPDGYWVKSVRMGDQDVKEAGIDLTRGPGDSIAIIIAPNAAQIDGAVQNDHQQPAPGATVVLVPEPKLREFQDDYKTTVTDQAGRFSLKNIEPGDYKLFAWEEIEFGAYMDPDFLAPLESRGQSISLQEGGRETVQLNVIAADSAAPKDK